MIFAEMREEIWLSAYILYCIAVSFLSLGRIVGLNVFALCTITSYESILTVGCTGYA